MMSLLQTLWCRLGLPGGGLGDRAAETVQLKTGWERKGLPHGGVRCLSAHSRAAAQFAAFSALAACGAMLGSIEDARLAEARALPVAVRNAVGTIPLKTPA